MDHQVRGIFHSQQNDGQHFLGSHIFPLFLLTQKSPSAEYRGVARSLNFDLGVAESWTSESRSREIGCSFAGEILVQRTPLTRWVFWQVWQKKMTPLTPRLLEQLRDFIDSVTPLRLPWLCDSAATLLTSLNPLQRTPRLPWLEEVMTPRLRDSKLQQKVLF